jgi:hypothetical protein
VSDVPSLSDADRESYRRAQLRELFDQWQPLTPREYIGIELCRRGFAAPGPHQPPPATPARKSILEPRHYLEAWRPGCLEREKTGQMVFQLFPPEFDPPTEKQR